MPAEPAADGVNFADPSGREFALAGSLAAASIGSTLNQAEGTAGQFALQSAENRGFD